MQILQELGLSFDDVHLIPRRRSIDSRFNGEIDLSTEILPRLELKYPIISANMDTVTEMEMAHEMNRLGGLGIIHRFMESKWQKEQVRKLLCPRVVCIGTGDSGLRRLRKVLEKDPLLEFSDHTHTSILIDIAHGHSDSMIAQIQRVKSWYPNYPVIAGNVATGKGAVDLAKAGADCIKVGVGPGSICTTRIKTGNGVPQLTAIRWVWEALQTVSGPRRTIIADGGIRSSGDIVKALAAGADAVMIGKLFAGTDDAPGDIISYPGGPPEKLYRGMASRKAQEDWKGQATSVEGEITKVPYRGKVEDIFDELVNGILSGMSYQDAHNLKELRDHAVFIKQTQAGYRESIAHGL